MKERKQNRLLEYDYSQSGYYFVTLCSNEHKLLFGKIIDGKMLLNQFGAIVKNNWVKIQPLHSNIELDEFTIMPNHIHGIIIIDNTVGKTNLVFPADRTKMVLSTIIQQFKKACTTEIKNKFNYLIPIWQRSFYDRIIRNENELYKIRKYIIQNPMKWDIENNSTENLELL